MDWPVVDSNLKIFSFGGVVANWWPLILILIGIDKMRGENKSAGTLLFVLGAVFLSATLDIVNWGNLLRFWPLILVFIGISLLMKRRGGSFSFVTRSEPSSEDFVKTSAIFGGVNRTVTSDNFRGGEVIALFGGIEIRN